MTYQDRNMSIIPFTQLQNPLERGRQHTDLQQMRYASHIYKNIQTLTNTELQNIHSPAISLGMTVHYIEKSS